MHHIWKLVTKHDSGTISAFRSKPDCGNGQRSTKFENRVRNGTLKSKLLTMGYGVSKIDVVNIQNVGYSNASKVNEESFLVIDMKDSGKLKHDLIRLGKFFDQDSVTLSKPSGKYYMISTSICPDGYSDNGSFGKSVKLGSQFFGKEGGFYSSVDGRPFVIEKINPNFAVLTDYSVNEIHSFVMNAKEVII